MSRPAGMPLGQWLSSRMSPAPSAQSQPTPSAAIPPTAAAAQATESISEIHRRLDGITRQIDQISQRRSPAAPAAPTPSGLASQLNDAISRLDMRLSNLRQSPPPQAQPQPPQPQASWTPPGYDTAAHATQFQAPAYQPSPPLSPIDTAIAEISARRSTLNGAGAPVAPPNPFMPQAAMPPMAPVAPPPPPAAPPVDLSGIERHLNHLTSQIEALRRPDHLDAAIVTFREELAEIRHSLTEALPRKAIDSLEVEIRALGQKIERSRENVGDQEALGSIERALNDIYGAVRTLTPAEQLSGYDTAIQNLSSKIDLLVRANPDSNIVQQLEDAIGALRGIAANVASNDSISQLSEHIRALGEKVDHLAQAGGNDMLAALEQRIALLTAAMEGRPLPATADTSHLERAITALSDRIDRLSVASDNSGAVAHVEQRIAYLLERLEGSQAFTNGNFGRIEEALADVLRQLEYQRTALAAPPEQSFDQAGFAETIKRELTGVRQAQSSTERLTQDTLEAVHSTLGHVVERLASIEGDLRRIPAQPEPPRPSAPPEAMSRPAYSDLSVPLQPQMAEQPPLASSPPFRHDDIPLVPTWTQTGQRTPINPNLPPDFPIEPGARLSEEAADNRPAHAPAADEGSSQSNFIAAARRAAQAASAATVEKPGRVNSLTEAARNAAAKATARVSAAGQSGDKPSRVRSILVGLSVVVIVLGTFRMAMSFLQESSPASAPIEKSNSVLPTTPEPKVQGSANPLLISPNALQQQSFVAPTPPQPIQQTPARPVEVATADATGSLTVSAPQPARPVEPAPAAPMAATGSIPDKLPDTVAGPNLRAAAGRGDPTALYEVAVRYAEGRGVPVNYEEAVKWYERAADRGVVMAMFRLGTMVEKGLGTAKDPDAARRHYVKAAERGNAKAMHNLAVLDADGGGRTPNYKSASTWFKKAADRGVADSQYNLGILYARGIGVEQNLAESFKWFSLAAAQGDADAARKRDDVAKRLDQQSLAAARLAIQTFTPEKQPDEAINVAAPAGGWDTGAAAAKKPAPKPAKQASR